MIALSIEAQLLTIRLGEMKIGEIIGYEELNRLTGMDVQRKRFALQTAQRGLLAKGIVFDVRYNQGLIRIDDAGKLAKSGRGLYKIRRLARHSAKIALAVDDFAALPNEQKIQHNALLSLFGAIRQCSTTKALERVRQSLAPDNGPLLFIQTLELFKKPQGGAGHDPNEGREAGTGAVVETFGAVAGAER